MMGEEDSQDVFCGSPSAGFLSAGLPIRSKTYQRPSPLRHRLQTSGNTVVSASESSPKDNQPRSKSTTDASTSVAISGGEMPSDTVNLSSQSTERLRPGEIRLLRLSPPGCEVETIVGSLASFTLGASPKYTAISYAWGDRKDISIIRIDGQPTPVTISLLHALTALRKDDESVWVWVDALSINQHDVEELNSQVQIMDSVYSNADTVAICLGPHSESDNSKLAFKFLKDIMDWKPWTLSNASGSKMAQDRQRLSSVVRLFDRDYWKRLWVVQEVFHAKQANVYCGSDCIALNTLFSACTVFDKFFVDIINLFPAGMELPTTTHYSHALMLTTQGPNSLLHPSTGMCCRPLEILRICRSKLTARPQDKILGVLSLLPRDIRSMLQPDFDLTPREVFTEIVTCVIKSTGSFDVICESIRFPFHQNSFGLPSWVPDWSHSPDTLSLAATSFSHRPRFAPRFAVDFPGRSSGVIGDKLRMRGTLIGTITARGMAVGTLGRLSDYLMAFLEWKHLLRDNENYRPSHTAEFCRTLCLGDVPEDVHQTLDRQYGLIGPPDVSFPIEAESSQAESLQMYEWQQITFDVFSQFLGERLGSLPLDHELQLHQKNGRKFQRGRQFLQDYFGDHMMGRCFCLLENRKKRGYMGMGTGYMGVDDLVVAVHGFSTPIVIRPTQQERIYEFIGDIYVDTCMDKDNVLYYGPDAWQEFFLY